MTEYFIGPRTQANYAIEDVDYGTPNTATTWGWLGIVEKIMPADDKEVKAILGMDDVDSRDVLGHDILVNKYGNTVTFKPQHFRHLVLPYGDAVDTHTGTDTITHTIALTAKTLPSFGMEVGFQHTSPFGIRYDGNVCNTYEIGSSKGDYVRSIMGLIAKDGTKITSYKAYQSSVVTLKKYTTAQLAPFRHQHVSIELNSVEYKTALNQWRLSLDNDCLAEPHDEDTISEPIPGLRKWSGSLDINMSTSAAWDLSKAGVATTIVVTLTKSATDKVVFTVNNPVLGAVNPPFDVTSGVVNVSIPFKADSITPVVTDTLDVDYDTVCA